MNVFIAWICESFRARPADARALLACLLWSMENDAPEEFSVVRASIPAVDHLVDQAPPILAGLEVLPAGRDGRILRLFDACGFSLSKAAAFVRFLSDFIADCAGADLAQRLSNRTSLIAALLGAPARDRLCPVSMPPARRALASPALVS